MMPWLVPLVLISLVAHGDLLGELARRLVTPPWRLIALFLAVVVLTIPHIGNLLQPGETAEFFAAKDPPCAAPFGNSVERWHDCQHELMWFAVPMPVYAAQGILSFEGALTLAAVSAGLLACLILLRADLLARAESASIAAEEAHGGGR